MLKGIVQFPTGALLPRQSKVRKVTTVNESAGFKSMTHRWKNEQVPIPTKRTRKKAEHSLHLISIFQSLQKYIRPKLYYIQNTSCNASGPEKQLLAFHTMHGKAHRKERNIDTN